MGVAVLAAYDGRRALALLDRTPDVLLLDLMLPKINGLEVSINCEPGGRKDVPVRDHRLWLRSGRGDHGTREMTVYRGEHFGAQEMVRWLEIVLQAMPARTLPQADCVRARTNDDWVLACAGTRLLRLWWLAPPRPAEHTITGMSWV